ncbi:MAG: c-type heme family protein [Thermodesulfovibrionales bacterium]
MKRLVNWILSPESHFRLALALSFPLIVVLVILMITAVRWEKRSLEDIQFANLREFSASLFNHILVTEIWTHGGHGGFYVEALHHTGEQRPRTALNILGKEFVKMKTSMVTPQVLSLLQRRAAYSFHITSLNPFSHDSMPDAWEAAAMKQFKEGGKEATDVLQINEKRYFRYMAPLREQPNCQGCHSRKDGTNDSLIGGLSMLIPIEATDKLFASQTKRSIISFSGIGIFLLASVLLLTMFFSHRIVSLFREKSRQQSLLQDLNAQLGRLAARDQAILASIVDGIVIIDESGIIESANTAFSQITGTDSSAIVGKPISIAGQASPLKEIFAPQPPDEVQIMGRVCTVTEVRIPTKDNTGLICTLRIVHDATDEKLSAAVALAGATAHEVRQPLSIMLSMMDIIRDDMKSGKDPSDKVAIFEQQLLRINDIITRMLRITRYQTKPYADQTKIFDLE